MESSKVFPWPRSPRRSSPSHLQIILPILYYYRLEESLNREEKKEQGIGRTGGSKPVTEDEKSILTKHTRQMKRCFLFILLRYYSSALIVSFHSIHPFRISIEFHFELATLSWEFYWEKGELPQTVTQKGFSIDV